jgi:hypothetical protein
MVLHGSNPWRNLEKNRREIIGLIAMYKNKTYLLHLGLLSHLLTI